MTKNYFVKVFFKNSFRFQYKNITLAQMKCIRTQSTDPPREDLQLWERHPRTARECLWGRSQEMGVKQQCSRALAWKLQSLVLGDIPYGATDPTHRPREGKCGDQAR